MSAFYLISILGHMPSSLFSLYSIYIFSGENSSTIVHHVLEMIFWCQIYIYSTSWIFIKICKVDLRYLNLTVGLKKYNADIKLLSGVCQWKTYSWS
jgi:hypothetical protein